MEHLAARGSTVPKTLTSGLEQVCEKWDEVLAKSMSPPESPSEYVTSDTFWKVVEVLGIGYASLLGMIFKLFHKTSKMDAFVNGSDRFRADVLEGQREMKLSLSSLRRVVDDVLLQRGRGADVNRSSGRRGDT